MPIGSFNLNGLAKILSSAYNYTPFNLIRSTENPTYAGTNQTSSWGQTVAMNSTYYAVGAPDDRTTTVGGRVDIFNISDGTKFRTITNPNSQTTDRVDAFGNNITMNSTYIAIGARTENTATLNDTGVIYVYRISDGALIYTLTDPTSPAQAASDNFGLYTIMNESYLLAGCPNKSSQSGAAYLYDLSTGSIVYTKSNPNPGTLNTTDNYGIGLAINNTYFYVGSPLEDISSTASAGAIFQYLISDGSLVSTIYNPNYVTTQSDQYGTNLVCNNSYLIVGAYSEDTPITDGGTVYVYDATTTLSSTPITTINDPNIYLDATLVDSFGNYLGLNNNYLFITSNEKPAGSSLPAPKHLFVYKTTDWSLYRFYENAFTGGAYTSNSGFKFANNDNYVTWAGTEFNSGDQGFVNLYNTTGTELTQADAIYIVDSATNTNSTTITIPATVIDGDIGILFDSSSTTGIGAVYPADWTSLASGSLSWSYRISYRRLKLSDASTSISGFTTGTRSKILLIIRGRATSNNNDAVIRGFYFSTPTGQTTTAAPTNQTIPMLSTQMGYMGFGVYMATSAITSRGSAGTYSAASPSSTEYSASTSHYVKTFGPNGWQSLGLADTVTLSMADYGSNALAGFVMVLTNTTSQVRPKYPLYGNWSYNASYTGSGGFKSGVRMPSISNGSTSVGPLRNANKFFTPGTGAYTIEWWAYYTTNPTANSPAWFDMGNDATQRAPLFYYNTSSNIRMLGGGSSGAGLTLLDFPSSSTWPSTSAWHHWAIVREGTASNQLKLYVDGVLKVTATDSGDYTSYPWSLNLGGLNPSLNSSGTQSFGSSSNNVVQIDEFRVSNIARYTGAFSVPTAAFVNDAYTKCLYHFDGGSYGDSGPYFDDATPYN